MIATLNEPLRMMLDDATTHATVYILFCLAVLACFGIVVLSVFILCALVRVSIRTIRRRFAEGRL